MAKQFLTSLDDEQLRSALTKLGEPRYRLDQILRWVYKDNVSTFAQMSDLPNELRIRLAERVSIRSIKLQSEYCSAEDSTRKLLFYTRDNHAIESVLIPRKDGYALCISSQVGCGMGCPFCATGYMGMSRNLESGEIIDQFLSVRDHTREMNQEVVSVIFMGMGEPMANFPNVRKAICRIISEDGCQFGVRRITISTIGVKGWVSRLSKSLKNVGLAVSLHAPDDELRMRLVPAVRNSPLAGLMQECKDHQYVTKRRTTYEYVMLRHVNDFESQAESLAKLLQGQLCHVNLIPFNRVTEAPFSPSDSVSTARFERILAGNGIPVTVRTPRGRDIDAACGQLAARDLT
tara:strand:- start:336 stop:1376 length:1041 start_codon:yes stop_codon:yes gene_type:complete